MTELTALPAFPETGLPDHVHTYLLNMHERVEELQRRAEVVEEEAIAEEERDRSVVGSMFRLESTSTITIGAGETLMQNNFTLTEETNLIISINLSLRHSSGSSLGVPAIFDVKVNGVIFGQISLTINNSGFFVGTRTVTVPRTSNCDVEIVQSTALNIEVENTGTNSITVLEIKE